MTTWHADTAPLAQMCEGCAQVDALIEAELTALWEHGMDAEQRATAEALVAVRAWLRVEWVQWAHELERKRGR